MSNQEQAQYIVSLPLSEFKAIKKAVATLRRAGMHTEEALAHLIQAHKDNRTQYLK
jgi:hypothetical protein